MIVLFTMFVNLAIIKRRQNAVLICSYLSQDPTGIFNNKKLAHRHLNPQCWEERRSHLLHYERERRVR